MNKNIYLKKTILKEWNMKIIICKTQQSHVLSLMLSFIVLKSNITSQPFMEEIVRIVSICRKEEKNGKKMYNDLFC